jgi:DNA invertase Pin-like site-specific DNA recombinase
MTNYKFNKEQHTAKIKAGLVTAKKKGKKLGRPRMLKGDKIKGEDEVIALYSTSTGKIYFKKELRKPTYEIVAEIVGISPTTVQKIINKYRNEKI